MIFNPIINIVLAVASLALGTVALINTDSWWFLLPSFIFFVLFAVSLFSPVTPGSADRHQPEPPPPSPFRKLTADRLRAHAPSTRGLTGTTLYTH